MFVPCDLGPDQLKAQDKEKENDAQDFARPPLGQPALQPGEQHAGQNDVHESKGEEHDGRPGEQARSGDSDADVDSEEPPASHSRCRV